MCVYICYSYICIYIYIYIHMYTIIYAYMYMYRSNNYFSDLRFGSSLETQELTTCAAEQSFMFGDCLKRRLLK